MEQGIKRLLIEELEDILSSEQQIAEALPEMAKVCDSSDLKEAFQTNLGETKEQLCRLEEIFKMLQVSKKTKFCKATKGLVDECKDVLSEMTTKSSLRDAALISKAQRIEHYEMAAYETVHTYAKELSLHNIAALLYDSLNEECHASKRLTRLAEGGFFSAGINDLANQTVIDEKQETQKQETQKPAIQKHETQADNPDKAIKEHHHASKAAHTVKKAASMTGKIVKSANKPVKKTLKAVTRFGEKIHSTKRKPAAA